jgi:hypothetical protein
MLEWFHTHFVEKTVPFWLFLGTVVLLLTGPLFTLIYKKIK